MTSPTCRSRMHIARRRTTSNSRLLRRPERRICADHDPTVGDARWPPCADVPWDTVERGRLPAARTFPSVAWKQLDFPTRAGLVATVMAVLGALIPPISVISALVAIAFSGTA